MIRVIIRVGVVDWIHWGSGRTEINRCNASAVEKSSIVALSTEGIYFPSLFFPYAIYCLVSTIGPNDLFCYRCSQTVEVWCGGEIGYTARYAYVDIQIRNCCILEPRNVFFNPFSAIGKLGQNNSM